MNLSKFITTYNTPFIPINTTFNDGTNKKQMTGMPKGYVDFDINMSANHFKQYKDKKNKYNQILMKIPDDIICIDTDTKDVYDKLTNYLHDKCLYDEASITDSFTGKSKKLNF